MTPAQLAQATGAPLDRALRWHPHITAAMAEYGIDTPSRKAMFLAQIGHESGSLKYSEEIWGPTAAQKTYEGRTNLGNIVPGDGYRFRGRGLVQTTGRFNYLKTGEALGLDLMSHPELLMEPSTAARSAAWYWHSRGLNKYADDGDNVGCTRKINGGLNGLDDRNKRWESAKIALAGSIENEPLPIPATPSFSSFLLGLLKMFTRKNNG